MSRRVSILLVVAVLAGFLGYALWRIFLAPSGLPPEGFALGNGRVEADLVDVSTRLSGRVAEIAVQEGDLVAQGDVLAVMDTIELAAQKMRAEAGVASAEAAVAVAKAGVTKAQANLALANSELSRAETLSEREVITRENLDIRRTEAQVTEAGLTAAQAEVRAKERAVDAETASLHEIEARIADSTLYAPQAGRILYRLTQPGEVLGNGGKVLTLVSLGNVYMEFFLPATQAPRVRLGDEARIVVDVRPDAAIPAIVSFVAPQAQFTPKQVETIAERESLMFRIRVRIPPQMVEARLAQVKTGVRGVAWVRLVGEDGSMTGYVADRDAVIYSRDDLVHVLTVTAADPAIGNITLFGHSMGGWLVAEALRQLRLGGQDNVIDRLGNVVLAAPDIDVDVFRRQMRTIGALNPPMTLLVSPDDRALKLSERLAGSRSRVGRKDVSDPQVHTLAAANGIRVIDISNMDALDKSNHNRFAALMKVLPRATKTTFASLVHAGTFILEPVSATLVSSGQ